MGAAWPTLNNPSDNGAATTTTPVFSWAPSTDPEGGAPGSGSMIALGVVAFGVLLRRRR